MTYDNHTHPDKQIRNEKRWTLFGADICGSKGKFSTQEEMFGIDMENFKVKRVMVKRDWLNRY